MLQACSRHLEMGNRLVIGNPLPFTIMLLSNWGFNLDIHKRPKGLRFEHFCHKVTKPPSRGPFGRLSQLPSVFGQVAGHMMSLVTWP